MPAKQKDNPVLVAHVTPQEAEAMKKLAKANLRTLSKELTLAIRNHLAAASKPVTPRS